jgi:hypothetical protein
MDDVLSMIAFLRGRCSIIFILSMADRFQNLFCRFASDLDISTIFTSRLGKLVSIRSRNRKSSPFVKTTIRKPMNGGMLGSALAGSVVDVHFIGGDSV